jgi:MSHA pilin protein MshD
MCIKALPKRQDGVSLIELILFIVIVAVGLVGMLSVMNLISRSSADPLIRKQALVIAESLMEEITLQSFTYCAPGDAAAATASSSNDCATQTGAPVAAKSRYSSSVPFDNVADYDGFSMDDAHGGIRNIANEPTGQAGYAVVVSVTGQGMPASASAPAIVSDAALLIVVTVTGPDRLPVVLESYRTRYAPNALP